MRRMLQLNVLLALGAGSLAAAAACLAGGRVDLLTVLVPALLVFAVYNFDRIADDSPAEGRSTPLRHAFVARWRRPLRVVIPLSLVVALALAWSRGPLSLVWAVAFPGLGIAYIVPIRLGRFRRLKDIPYLKAFYAPAVWLTLIWLGAALGGEGANTEVVAFTGFVFLRMFVSAYLGDIRDAADDAAAGVLTPAQRLGVPRSHRLLGVIHLASAGLIALAVAMGALPTAGLGLLLAAAIGFFVYRLYRRFPERHELLFELYDLEFVAYAPSLALLGMA